MNDIAVMVVNTSNTRGSYENTSEYEGWVFSVFGDVTTYSTNTLESGVEIIVAK